MADLDRLVLGTAGLGLAYGLPGADGQPRTLISDATAAAVITAAWELGIRTFDTAPAYGCAEERLGHTLGNRGAVWTKLAADEPVVQSLAHSLARLSRERIDLLQCHNWKPGAISEADWRDLAADREHVAALGCSTYGVEDACAAIACARFRVVQVEWNLLNQAVLTHVAARGLAQSPMSRVRIAVRSIWLQGVLQDRPLPPALQALGAARDRARRMAESLGLSLPVLALRAALDHPLVNYVLIGADDPSQFEVVRAALAAPPLSADTFAQLAVLHVDSPITDPRTWSNR